MSHAKRGITMGWKRRVPRILFALLSWTVISMGTTATWAGRSSEARGHGRRHGKIRHRGARKIHAQRGTCRGKRYGCVGHRPTYYDQFVRVISRPRKGYDRGCLRRLRKAGIEYRLLGGVKGVRTPVEVLSKRLGGVRYIKHWSNHRRFILDCHTVEVLAWVGRAIRMAGVASIYFASSWRYTYLEGTHRLSQHAHGKALDIPAIDGSFGYATVVRHYQKGRWGCGERNDSPKAAVWRRFYCALKLTGAFGRIFTPDYNKAHRDHFHIEAPRASVRLGQTPRPRFGVRHVTSRSKRRSR